MLLENEVAGLEALREKLASLRDYLNQRDLPGDDLDEWLDLVTGLTQLQGNLSNDQSFVATLLAKRYLMDHHPVGNFDAASKPQGAPGLDIDVTDDNGERIVGEIKTTVPYDIARNNLGAKQLETFRKDFDKLNQADATYRYFFVTNPVTYEIVRARYANEIPTTQVVLLGKWGLPG